MFTRMLLPVVSALILCGSLAAESAADTAEKQQWKVQLAGDSAVVQIAEGTEHKFVRATITALRDAGSEKTCPTNI